MYKKLLGAAAMTLALVACDKDNGPAPMNDFTFQGSFEPGTYEDFKHTAGDHVYFALNSSNLSKEAKADLDKQVDWLKKYPKTIFTVEGHADERGTSEYNLALGDRRAHAVRKHIVGAGVSEERISTVSFGKERPDAIGHNEGAWAKNRRAVSVVH